MSIESKLSANPAIFRDNRFLLYLTLGDVPRATRLSSFDLLRLYPDEPVASVNNLMKAGPPATVRELHEVEPRPILTRGNRIITEPGYDEGTKSYFHFGNVRYPRAMAKEKALEVIDQYVGNLFAPYRLEYRPQIVAATLTLAVARLYAERPPAFALFRNRQSLTSIHLTNALTSTLGGRRPLFLVACLSLVKAFREAGSPMHDFKPLAGYPGFDRLVRSCVAWAYGVDFASDCFANQEPVKGIRVWGEQFGW